jgi:hypothetical protein
MSQWCFSPFALAAICLLSACQQGTDAQSDTVASGISSAAPPPALPVIEPPMDRAALIGATARAASDAALGKDGGEWQRLLDGKRFVLRMRFGCPGSEEAEPTRHWAFDPAKRRLDFQIRSEIARDTAQIAALGELGYEDVQGFWLARPWLLAAGCPLSVPAPAATATMAVPDGTGAGTSPTDSVSPVPPSALRVGIAQFFDESDARTHRRGERGYSIAKTVGVNVTISRAGYDLVVTGRLKRLASGRVIACAVRGVAVPPDCIVSVQIEGVAILEPASGQVVADWVGG